MIKRLLFIFSFLCLTCFVGNPVYAQSAKIGAQPISSMLSVTPILMDIELLPGKTQNYPITVTNVFKESLGIHAQSQGFSPDGEGDQITTVRAKNSLTDWSSLSETDFILAPGESKQFFLSLSTPAQAEKKGYYEVIFLTPFYVRNDAVTQPTVLTKIGIVVLGHTGSITYADLQKKVHITAFDFDTMVYASPPVTTTIRVTNDYFTHFSAKPVLTIIPLFGKPVVMPFADKHILPGTTRRWDESITLPRYNTFFYRAHLSVSLGDGKQISKDSFFILLPSPHILAYGVIVVVLLGFIGIRTRLMKAFTILIGRRT